MSQKLWISKVSGCTKCLTNHPCESSPHGTKPNSAKSYANHCTMWMATPETPVVCQPLLCKHLIFYRPKSLCRLEEGFGNSHCVLRHPSAEHALHIIRRAQPQHFTDATFRAGGICMCSTPCPHIACIGSSSGTCESHNWSIPGSGHKCQNPASSSCHARIPLPLAVRGSVAAQVLVQVFDVLVQRSGLGALLLGSNSLPPTSHNCTGAPPFLPIWSHKHSKSDVSNDMSCGCTPKTIAP